MKITGCVFDFGGVMTATTMPERLRPIVSSLGVDWKILVDGYDRYRRLMDGDVISYETMYDLIFADAGVEVPADAVAAIIAEDMESYRSRNERTVEFMRSLKERGFKIGILTNMCTPFVPGFKKHFADFIELADAMVISGEERMFKPQRRIYDLLARRISLPAEELCFFDDVTANCEGARKAGWNCVQFANIDQAIGDFEKLLNA